MCKLLNSQRPASLSTAAPKHWRLVPVKQSSASSQNKFESSCSSFQMTNVITGGPLRTGCAIANTQHGLVSVPGLRASVAFTGEDGKKLQQFYGILPVKIKEYCVVWNVDGRARVKHASTSPLHPTPPDCCCSCLKAESQLRDMMGVVDKDKHELK